MRIAANGNIGIGDSTPGGRFLVIGATSDSTAYALMASTANGNVILYARNDRRLGVGTSNPGQTLHVDGGIRYTAATSDTNTTVCRNSSGDLAGCSSLRALKDNITDLPLGLDAVMRLRPVAFDWRSYSNAPAYVRRDLGFIAEEVAAISPLLARYSDVTGELEGVRYSQLSSLLTRAVQEQQQLIITQRDKLSLFSSAVQLGEGGFVGLGTSTPEARLHVVGDVAVQAAGTAAPATMRLRSSRAAGEAGMQGLVSFADGAGGTVAGLAVQGAGTGARGSMLFFTGDASDLSDPARASVVFSASGDVGIGTSTPGYRLDVRGGDAFFGGSVTAASFALPSDARFKTNVQAITDALSIVRRLQGVSYDWNRAAFPERNFSARPQIGVLAQQMEAVLPELVSTDAQGYKSVNYLGLVPVLIEGMKQQATQLEAQDERLTKTEKQLGLVEERLFKNEEQVVKLDERLGKAESFVARFELTAEPDTMVVLTPTFKVQNFTAERAYIAELRAQRIEAERARFKELDADGAVIDNVEAARLRGRLVNTGGKELFVSYGAVAPLFEAVDDGHYIVSVSAEDGSFATAQVINAGGVLRVVPTASQGIDVVANGNSVGLVAPSKKVKASWTRTG